MVRIRHFEFLCQSMHIEPLVYQFRVFYELPVLKDVPSIELPEKALVAAKMSLHWKADLHDRPVYVEDDKKKGKMSTAKKGADEETWCYRIVKNFALLKGANLNAQPSAGFINLGVCPKSKKKKRGPVAFTAPKKPDTSKADISKEEKKKGLAPVVVQHPKAEPRDTADIPPSNPEESIDLESSPEPLARTKAAKRKKPEGKAAAQPAKKIVKKKINKRGNLDAFATKFSPVIIVPSSSAPASELPTDDVQENPLYVEQGFVIHDEEDNSPIRPEETLGDYYYYRTYSEKRASEIHAPVWKLKQGDTFSNW
ncbi:hypothetical protein Hanom_Chr10g00906161 [Helianthus anomalus]